MEEWEEESESKRKNKRKKSDWEARESDNDRILEGEVEMWKVRVRERMSHVVMVYAD